MKLNRRLFVSLPLCLTVTPTCEPTPSKPVATCAGEEQIRELNRGMAKCYEMARTKSKGHYSLVSRSHPAPFQELGL